MASLYHKVAFFAIALSVNATELEKTQLAIFKSNKTQPVLSSRNDSTKTCIYCNFYGSLETTTPQSNVALGCC